MNRLFFLTGSEKSHPAVNTWFTKHSGELADIAEHWFNLIRSSGNDVRELLHDGHPTACINEAAFVYVDIFKKHLNIGFYNGSELADPLKLLEGNGKYMRHVKLKPQSEINSEALTELIKAAYSHLKDLLELNNR